MSNKLICMLLLIVISPFLLATENIVIITISGCVPGDGKHTVEKPAGFFWGIWHGWIAPISLIGGIFNSDIRVYEPTSSKIMYHTLSNLGYPGSQGEPQTQDGGMISVFTSPSSVDSVVSPYHEENAKRLS